MFKERIREHYENLTPGFRKLADFIITRTMDVAFLTATELSRTVGVDPATVVRFSQEIGYSGYRELSREIKSYVRAQVTATARQVTEAETEAELLDGLMANAFQSLERFMTTDKGVLIEAADMLQGAARVWVTGEDVSYHIAAFFAGLLESIGTETEAFYPGMLDAATAIARMEEGDVALAVVLGGPGVDVGYALNQAKEKGVKTLCITGSGVALPAREADLTVLVPMQSPLDISSYSAALTIVAIIWESIAGKRTEKAAASKAALEDQMKKFLDLRAETPQYDVKTEASS